MKILIINQGGRMGNVGDDAILEGMRHYLLGKGHQCRHVGFSKLGEKFLVSGLKIYKFVSPFISQKGTGVFLKPFKYILAQLLWIKRNLNRIKQECARDAVDIALIGGGELIQSNGIFPLALWMWTYMLKQRTKTPCFLFSVGVSEHIGWFDRLLIRYASRRLKGVFIRDKMSLHRWNTITGDVKAEIAYDPAFLLPGKLQKCSKEHCLVLFCPTSYKFYNAKCFDDDKISEERYAAYWLDMMNKYKRAGNEVALISTNNSQDPPFHNYLAHRYHEQFGVNIQCIQGENLEEFRQHLAKSNAIISGRLHALILGYVQGIKVIPFFTSAKVKCHYESILKKNVPLQDLNEVTRLAINTCCSFAEHESSCR